MKAAFGKLLLAIAFTAAGAPVSADSERQFHGLLRARDLTPFGYLRLDMRPALAGYLEPGAWALETELAYQNTWALSPEVQRYLNALPGRRELGPDELEVVRDLPGENYLVDLELAQLDLTLHFKITPALSGYMILSGASYNGGFLDHTIEEFHSTFGFGRFGRPAAAQNDVNILLDLKSAQYAAFEAPTSGGLLDPTLGLRYSNASFSRTWKLVLESAVKLPVRGRRTLLSTGRTDFGAQATLQRFYERHALYASLSGVYYAGTREIVPSGSEIIPTLVLGYEHAFTGRTNGIVQGYISRSAYENETDLNELLGTKYQVSLGVRHSRGPHQFTFAITENLQNINNTPDIGVQMNWTYVPRSGVSAEETDSAAAR